MSPVPGATAMPLSVSLHPSSLSVHTSTLPIPIHSTPPMVHSPIPIHHPPPILHASVPVHASVSVHHSVPLTWPTPAVVSEMSMISLDLFMIGCCIVLKMWWGNTASAIACKQEVLAEPLLIPHSDLFMLGNIFLIATRHRSTELMNMQLQVNWNTHILSNETLTSCPCLYLLAGLSVGIGGRVSGLCRDDHPWVPKTKEKNNYHTPRYFCWSSVLCNGFWKVSL